MLDARELAPRDRREDCPYPAAELDDQHTDHRWLTALEADLHEYVKRYVDEYDLL